MYAKSGTFGGNEYFATDGTLNAIYSDGRINFTEITDHFISERKMDFVGSCLSVEKHILFHF